MTGKRTYRVGFYVEVEVDAYEGEAVLVAESACQWPGSGRVAAHQPVEVRGYLDTKPVKGRVMRSQALMVKEATEERTP